MTSIVITILMIGVAVVISSVLLVVVDLLSELEHLK
jgi:hypothetical protein